MAFTAVNQRCSHHEVLRSPSPCSGNRLSRKHFFSKYEIPNSLVNTNLFYANFTYTQLEKGPIPQLTDILKLALSENMRSDYSVYLLFPQD